MGLPMAQQLEGAGFDVWGFDLRPPDQFGEFQSRMIPDPRAFAMKIDTVISVVRDFRETMDLFFDKQALFGARPYPKLVICSSTVSPRVLPDIIAKLPDEVVMIDAPMSGAPDRAKNGTLTFMVGGNDTDVNTAMPLLNAMGEKINHLGPLGQGMTCKVINNFVAVTSVATVRKAIDAAKALGVDPMVLINVMRTSSGGTWYGDNIDEISWAYEAYDPTNTMGILEKDMIAFLDAISETQNIAAETLARSVLDIIRKAKVLEL